MNDGREKSADAIRKQVLNYLAALTPQEAKVLRARFGISTVDRSNEGDEASLRALARELARLKKKR
jgi:DNA-directed RNA polymerase sigma subunit (sigma70/sigma32)